MVAYFSGVWQVPDFAEGITNFEWASAPTPGPVHATDINLGGKVVAFNNKDTAAAAKKWVDFLFQRDNYTKLAESNGYLPVESGLTLKYPFKSKAALDAYTLYTKEIELADPISSSGQAAGTKLLLAGKEAGEDPTKGELAKFVNGQQDVQKTVDNIVERPQRLAGLTPVRRLWPKRRLNHYTAAPLALISINLLLLVTFFVWPAVTGLLYSFTSYTGIGTAPYVGWTTTSGCCRTTRSTRR